MVPDAEIKAEADKLKQRGDFTDPPDTLKDNQVSRPALFNVVGSWWLLWP